MDPTEMDSLGCEQVNWDPMDWGPMRLGPMDEDEMYWALWIATRWIGTQ